MPRPGGVRALIPSGRRAEGVAMHQQIRTSPRDVGRNVDDGLAILAARGINVEGVGPDFESPHARFVVPHPATDDALAALRENSPDAELRHACTVALANRPGELSAVLRRIGRAGFVVESVLVLASRHNGRTLVSVGLNKEPSRGLRDEVGCLDEPYGWLGGDIDELIGG
jgi:hypothetical protein